MCFAERGAEHGDHVGEPVLMGHQAIGVAFQHDDLLLVRDAVAGRVEAVQLAALGEERRLGRVDVLGRAVVGELRQHAAAERDRPRAGVADRKQHAAAEAIVVAAFHVARDRQAGALQQRRPETASPEPARAASPSGSAKSRDETCESSRRVMPRSAR